MHITNKEKILKRKLLTDHTSISSEIEKNLENKLWNDVLPELPKGTLLVGGYIRDIILGRLNRKPDIDLIVPINPMIIAEKIVEKSNAKLIVLDKKRNILRLIFDLFILDISKQVGGSILEDLSSRDFTINAIAFSLDSKLLIDPLNGINDLHNGIIKTQKMKNILDDPLRILRCFRFISELNFRVDEKLIDFITINKDKLNSISGERIQYELRKIFKGVNALTTILFINEIKMFDWSQSYQNISSTFLQSINYEETNLFAINEHKILFYLVETLEQSSIKKFKFSKTDNLNSIVLRKWKEKLTIKSIEKFNELERFYLHKELEEILPSFIAYLPERLHSDWLNRWRNEKDRLFHPKNFISGESVKKHINIKDGPLLGKLLSHLSIEFAYHRINNFDEAIFKAQQWFEQNAPKCD